MRFIPLLKHLNHLKHQSIFFLTPLVLLFNISNGDAQPYNNTNAYPLTEAQRQQFNHFIDLNNKVIQESQRSSNTACSINLIQSLETINSYLLYHPFIANKLAQQGSGDMALNLTVQQAQCASRNQQFSKSLRVLDRGIPWAQPQYISDYSNPTYHLYIIERADAYSQTKQWQAGYTLLNNYVHSPMAPFGSLTTQANITDLWADALLSQGQFDDARRMYSRYLGQLHGHFPQRVNEIEHVKKMIQSLRTPNPNDADTQHYIDSTDQERYQWHPKTHQVVILFAPPSEDPLNPLPPQTSPLLQWTPDRKEAIRHALDNWSKALQPVHPIQFSLAQQGEPYDVAIQLTPQLEQNQLLETMGYNQTQFLGHTLTQNNIILAMLDSSGIPQDNRQLYATALHEIGHMMGLPHSPYVGDVMSGIRFSQYGLAPPFHLSPRDINSIRQLYTQKAINTNTPHTHLSQTK